MKNLDCLFIGSATHDILMLVDEAPQSDQRIAASRLLLSGGGPATTAAAAFSSLGGRTGLVSAVGEDAVGKVIREDLTGLGFSYLELHTLAGEQSALSAIQVENNGKRCITAFGGCMQALEFDELDKEVLHSTRYVHLAGAAEPLFLPLARYLRENTAATVSVDGGNFSRSFINAILPLSHIFIPDDKTVAKAYGFTPQEACRYFYEQGPKIVAVTRGSEGSIAYDGDAFYETEALTVDVVDTTGAGDNYHGAFLYAQTRGWSLPKSLRFASVFSSLTCRGLGGREALPEQEVVLRHLNTPVDRESSG